MFGYKLDMDVTCYNTVVPVEEYGEWQSDSVNVFKGLIRNDAHPDVSSVVELESSTLPHYLVWVEYSDGDSFGWAKRGRIEAVGIFTTAEDALKVKEAIKADAEARSTRDTIYGTPLEVSLSDRNLVINYVPWCGYFESLDEVHIETVNMLSVNKF